MDTAHEKLPFVARISIRLSRRSGAVARQAFQRRPASLPMDTTGRVPDRPSGLARPEDSRSDLVPAQPDVARLEADHCSTV